MFIKKKILLLLILMICSQGNTKTLKAYLGSTITKTDFDRQSKEEPLAVDMGGLALKVVGAISPQGYVEIDMLHSNKQFFRREDLNLLVEQTQVIQFNIGYRREIWEYMSASLLFVSAYSLGEPKRVYYKNPGNIRMDTSASDYTEYGFDFGIQTELYQWDLYALALDFNYMRSLTNKKNESANHFGAFIGIKYLVVTK